MPNSAITAKANTSATLSCESDNGQPWSLCVWEHKSQGQQRLVVINQGDAQNGGQTPLNGILFVGDALYNNGKCELRIDSITDQDFGQWSCTLLTNNGTTSTGELSLRDDLEQSVYFVTSGRGLSVYSLERNAVKKIVNSQEIFRGITYDSSRNELYWSGSGGKIYRANKDGSVVETVLNTNQYGTMWGLALDWIGRNIYVSTWDGYILACSISSKPNMSCFTLLDGQTGAVGIALNPLEGTMYWTRYNAGSLHKAGMDGSNPTTIASGLDSPLGLTIDFTSGRLYWGEYGNNKIQTSRMDGQDRRTAVQLPSNSHPFGIALSNDRIYWGNYGNDKLQSSSRDGQDIQTLYTETADIIHVILVPAWNQPTNRTNHCEGQKCSKLCVLIPTSYRCLS